MATSGTVATTTIDTAKLIEHAVRRCKIPVTQQTPELIMSAKESLYMLLLSLANRGINLWCVERQFIGLTSGEAIYAALPGTIDVLNVIYSHPTRATGTDTTTATSVTTDLAEATGVTRVGVMFDVVAASGTMTISSSDDDVTYTTVLSETRTDWEADVWYWFDVPVVSAHYFRVNHSGAITVSEFYLASSVYDLPLSQFNRDTWAAMPNKQQLGDRPTNYYLEKLLDPQVTLWPVPRNSYDHITLFCHRQVQDIGRLTESIEVPGRWYEGITWQLALRVAFEAPDVPPQQVQILQQMAQQYLLEAEADETDGAPLYIQPNIGVYTR